MGGYHVLVDASKGVPGFESQNKELYGDSYITI